MPELIIGEGLSDAEKKDLKNIDNIISEMPEFMLRYVMGVEDAGRGVHTILIHLRLVRDWMNLLATNQSKMMSELTKADLVQITEDDIQFFLAQNTLSLRGRKSIDPTERVKKNRIMALKRFYSEHLFELDEEDEILKIIDDIIKPQKSSKKHTIKKPEEVKYNLSGWQNITVDGRYTAQKYRSEKDKSIYYKIIDNAGDRVLADGIQKWSEANDYIKKLYL